ncbi:hypothetical protein [Paraburkholderia xenovorans]|uniref:hypothetical protein n=1 Tax=Paraburkholderia xenovorans TaxID=36873 RepID=UPI0019F5162F|nr:hypothetical protein [Paraburkholderia xenovorans]NPT36331.1 hypothetical protein [Paraburkholderia xenovorans]
MTGNPKETAPVASGNARPMENAKADNAKPDRMERSLLRDIKPVTGPAVPPPRR